MYIMDFIISEISLFSGMQRGKIKMKPAEFKVDVNKCNGCGKCLQVCPGNMVGGKVLQMKDGHPYMTDELNYGWCGCWRCEHCLAVCPQGAISIFGINPDEAPEKPDSSISDELPRLIKFRRTCRSFQDKDVDKNTIDKLIEAISNVPTGGNSFGLEFSLIESGKAMDRLYNILFPEQQIGLFDDGKRSRMLIYGAPHLFMAHKKVGTRFHDGDLTELGVATAYFELLADSFGLGTVITNYSCELILKNKKAREMLQIPDDHTVLALVGFGYPKIQYQRGVIKYKRVHRIS